MIGEVSAIAVFIEVESLDHRSHRAVENDDSVPKDLLDLLRLVSAFCVSALCHVPNPLCTIGRTVCALHASHTSAKTGKPAFLWNRYSTLAPELHPPDQNLFLGVETMQNRIHTPVWVAIIALATALMVGGVTSPIVHSSTEPASYTVTSDTLTQVVFNHGFLPVVKSCAHAAVNFVSFRTVLPF